MQSERGGLNDFVSAGHGDSLAMKSLILDEEAVVLGAGVVDLDLIGGQSNTVDLEIDESAILVVELLRSVHDGGLDQSSIDSEFSAENAGVHIERHLGSNALGVLQVGSSESSDLPGLQGAIGIVETFLAGASGGGQISDFLPL